MTVARSALGTMISTQYVRSARNLTFVSLVSFVLTGHAAHAHASLTEAARLSAIYDTILDARFDEAERQIARACPPAPLEACKALSVVSLWWQIMLDPYNRSRDDRLEKASREATASASDWTRREPSKAEAWFYLAGSYGPSLQLRILRGERLSAARDALRVKSALERALSLDSSLQDAYFGIGLYHYYADVAPTAAKILRVLLLMPGGDRQQGLKEMLQARERGQLLAGEADFQLHWLYLWYEHDPARALELLRRLDARYPSNPRFLERIAEVQHEYFHDHVASASTWQMLIDHARTGHSSAPQLAETRARLGLAAESIELGRPAAAIEQLKAVVAMRSTTPYSAQAIAQIELGRAYDAVGQRDLASQAYDQAVALAPEDDPLHVRSRARAAMRERARTAGEK
jgi:tetratricopeptide (TPR) repeat protein